MPPQKTLDDLAFVLNGTSQSAPKDTSDEAWDRYVREIEQQAVAFNKDVEFIRSKGAFTATSPDNCPKCPERTQYQALVYDDGQFVVSDDFGCIYRCRQVTDCATSMNAEFGLHKWLVGTTRGVVLGRNLVNGWTSVDRRRIEGFISGPVVPNHPSELRSRLCALNWAPECTRFLGLARKILDPYTKMTQKQYITILEDELAILVLQLLFSTVTIMPLAPLCEDMLQIIIGDGNPWSGTWCVIQMKIENWEGGAQDVRKVSEVLVLQSSPNDGNPKELEGIDCEIAWVLDYAQRFDAKIEHRPRILCMDSELLAEPNYRKNHHPATEKGQVRRIRQVDRLLDKPLVKLLTLDRGAIEIVDSIGRSDRRLVDAESDMQKKFLTPNKVLCDLLPR